MYLAALYRAEVGIAQAIHRLAGEPHPLAKIDVQKAIQWVEGRLGLELAAGQKEAVRQVAPEHHVVLGVERDQDSIVLGVVLQPMPYSADYLARRTFAPTRFVAITRSSQYRSSWRARVSPLRSIW